MKRAPIIISAPTWNLPSRDKRDDGEGAHAKVEWKGNPSGQEFTSKECRGRKSGGRFLSWLAVSVLAQVLYAPAAFAAVAADSLSPLGICWGRVAHSPVPPAPVVAMLKDNPHIARVKLFDADGVVLSALAELGTTVEVMVMVRNGDLQAIAIDDATADGWVYANLLATLPTGVNIKYVSVGNEPYLNNTQPFDAYLMLAVNRLQSALDRAGLVPRIKLTVSFNSEILGTSSNPPSNGKFVSNWVNQITNITSLINSTGSFFSVNIYPFFAYSGDQNISLPFIMFQQGAKPDPDPNGLVYMNILDKSYDAVLAALARIGFPNLEVRIGEIGWPSDGGPVATLALSQQFNQGAIAHLLSGVGTPRRPNTAIPFYIFGLFDEDAKSIKAGAYERRWGIYNDLGGAKYSLDLSGGTDPNAQLPTIQGLTSLPNRWCIASSMLTADPNSADSAAALQSMVGDICGSATSDYSDAGDCTPLTSILSSPGLQCASASNSSSAPNAFNASYALNAKFQAEGQSTNSCVFGGNGMVTYTDPSTPSCTFAIGLDIQAIDAYFQPSKGWSWEAFGYIVALIVILATFL